MSAGGNNIRYAVLAKLSDGLLLASFKSRAATQQTLDTTKKVLSSGNVKPKTQLTVTVDETVGTLHLVAGEVDVLAVITAPNYPRRSAFQFLAEFRSKVSEAIPVEGITGATKEGEYGKQAAWLKELCIKYEDLASVDKISAVNNQVEEVKAIMEGNVNKMLDNAESINVVEDKSEQLRAGAEQFYKRSEQVKRIMWWRMCKLKLIFGLLVACILGYILVPIFAKLDDED